MTSKEKNHTKKTYRLILLLSCVLVPLSMLVACGPSADELAAVDYTPLPGDD